MDEYFDHFSRSSKVCAILVDVARRVDFKFNFHSLTLLLLLRFRSERIWDKRRYAPIFFWKSNGLCSKKNSKASLFFELRSIIRLFFLVIPPTADEPVVIDPRSEIERMLPAKIAQNIEIATSDELLLQFERIENNIFNTATNEVRQTVFA